MAKHLDDLIPRITRNKKNILKCAKEVRTEFEEKSIDQKTLVELYSEYNHRVGNVDIFIEQARDLFPRLNCGVASLYLKERLMCGRIIRGKYNRENHTFLLIDDTTVVDITADQYGGPKIYVGPLRSPWYTG